jgi:hypothetical protein
MPILNYTTKVDSSKTVSEIQSILGRKGASHVSVDYRNAKASAVTFGLSLDGMDLNFRLPCNIDGVSAALKKDGKSAAGHDRSQCERVAWRIVKDWVEAQMALVEAGQAEVSEVFMPYAIHSSGMTLFQAMKNRQLQLSDGETAVEQPVTCRP